jgi:kynurenine formamidase
VALADRTPPTAAEYADFRNRFKNWGRWGPDDELGTLNHITGATRKAAASLVTGERCVSMARALDTTAAPANPYPAHHFLAMPGTGGMLDYVGLFIHGMTQTHIDALCHLMTPEGHTWNDKPMRDTRTPMEHSGTIDFMRSGIVTRGVLYDVPRHRGKPYVAPGEPVHGWELQDIAEAEGIEPRAGDAVIIRSGFGPYWADQAEPAPFASIAGVHCSCIEFLHSTDASLLIWDMQDAPTADQGVPSPGGTTRPVALHVHHILLPYMGMPIVDNADLEELSTACAELNRWEFQLAVAPLFVPGGTGSPVNPIASF